MDERDLLRARTSGTGEMASPSASEGVSASCPWCSRAVPAGAATCPGCGATAPSAAPEELQVPGVTTIDPAVAALLNRSAGKKSTRGSGFVSWLSGEPRDVHSAPAPGEVAFAPPSEEVRREMLRLELESRRHELESSIVPEVPDEDRRVDRR